MWNKWAGPGLQGQPTDCSDCAAESIRLQVQCSGGEQIGKMKSLCGQISETDLAGDLGTKQACATQKEKTKH